MSKNHCTGSIQQCRKRKVNYYEGPVKSVKERFYRARNANLNEMAKESDYAPIESLKYSYEN